MRNDLLLVLAVAISPLASAYPEGDPKPAAPVSFSRDVRPILDAHCAGCHQPARPRGGLTLTSHAELMAGGENGPSVVPGAPDKSLLVTQIAPHDGAAPLMPQQREALATKDVDVIKRWVEQGAKDDTPKELRDPIDAKNPPTYERAPIITSLAYSPDGSLIAVSGHHETLLHHADGSGLVKRLVGRAERVESVAFSPDGRWLAVAGGSPGRLGELQIWDAAKGELKHAESVTTDSIRGASWSADSHLVAFGCGDHSVRALDVTTWKPVLYSAAHDDFVLGTAFSLDGSHLVSVSRDRSMKLVKVATQQFIDNITSITPGQTKGGLMAVVRHPSQDVVLTGGADGVPRIYKIFREQARRIGDDFNLVRAFDPMPGRIGAVAFGKDGQRIAVASSFADGGEVRVYDAADGKLVWSHPEPVAIFTVAFSPDGSAVAIAGREGVVHRLDGATGAELGKFVPVPLREPASRSTAENLR